MTRDELEHAIRAACDVSGDDEVYVFGSQAILGQYPDAPSELRRSMEVDVSPKNRPETVDIIDANLGELSPFHREFGFYVHGLPIEQAATLPGGWEDRAIAVFDEDSTRGNTGWCLEAHDLAASKLVAFRDKDRDFVRLLLVERLISLSVLRERIQQLGVSDEEESRLLRWLDRIQSEMDST
jgi:hypothetical protein